MAETSAISWTDSTFNPWIGCTKVGPGCDHCYAERDFDKRLHVVNWGPRQPRQRTKPANWVKPLQWDREAFDFHLQHGRRRRVFCASLADIFDNEVDPQWRADLFDLIEATSRIDWLILTKRIGNVQSMVTEAKSSDWLARQSNVFLGVTVVNQEEADRDIPKLLATRAQRRFLSIEPMLGAIDLSRFLWQCCGNYQDGAEYMGSREGPVCCGTPESKNLLDWVIAGGESGPSARPSHPAWFRSVRDQCAHAGVPYHFKQWGEWAPHAPGASGNEGAALRSGYVRYLEGDGREPDGHFRRGDAAVARVGKKAAGRLLDGIEHNGFPQSFHN